MLVKNLNVIRHNVIVTQELRNQLNKHKSVVIWFTGLSGSGKSTISHLVEEELYKLGCRTFVLDGDNVRHGLSSNLTFSDSDRKENIRRAGEVARLMSEAGIITMAAFISPFEEDRSSVRKLLPQGGFIEVYCKASLEVCESRDVKGFYKRARTGEIKDYTGIDSTYEEPNNPELVIDSDIESIQDSVAKVIDFLKIKKIIN